VFTTGFIKDILQKIILKHTPGINKIKSTKINMF